MGLISGSYSVGQNLYHLEWCPKYRYKMFMKEESKKLCEDILKEVVKRHEMKMEELSVMSDHIHAVVGIPPTMSVSQAFHLLKGTSSRELFKQKPNFRKRYDTETVMQYVRDQRLEQTSLDSLPTTANRAS